jgi:glycosyltransferase involved in cell wall biosynthesis
MEEKIIVLTPVKNESWILDRFLTITSEFADQIIVADQSSTDGSMDICRKYAKTIIINNDNKDYDEESRQKLLINTARKLFPHSKRILFALDADEIITADGMKSSSWDIIRKAHPGTTFYFEKPELIDNTQFCVRWPDSYFPLAYIDDDAKHSEGSKVHSKRIPINSSKLRVDVDEIKFMHYALTREKVQAAKMRFYSVQENLLKTRSIFVRRHWYKAPFSVRKYVPAKNIEPTPKSWFEGYEVLRADIRSVEDLEYSWHDYEVLKIFGKYGTKSFYLDNIWHFDWEKCRKNAIAFHIKDIPSKPIKTPPKGYLFLGRLLDFVYGKYQTVRKLRK